MPSFKWDCPRCQATSATFDQETLTYHARDRDYYASCTCAVCQRPTLFKLRVMPRETDFTDLLRSIPDILDPRASATHASNGLKSIEVVETYPTMLAREVPEHLPPNVSESFLSAHEAYRGGKYEAAAFSVRQALERAVRYLDPNAAGGLKARIAALHAKGLVPERLVALAYKVRTDDNGNLQENPWSEENVRKLIEYARLFFVEVFTLLARQSAGVLVQSSGRGTRLEKEAVIRGRGSQHPYLGPAYDGALWLDRPRLQADGSIEASVCWDRRGRDWEKIVIDSRGVVMTSAFASGVMAIFVTYGQSLGRGSTTLAHAAAYTSSAVDPGNALMFDQASFFNPVVGDGATLKGFTDLRHVLTAQYGETHLGSFALQMLECMRAAGAKIPSILWSKAAGGHSLHDLREDIEGYVPNGKIGGCWQDMMMSINHASTRVVSAYGRKPAIMPLTFIHGEEDSGWPGLAACEYLAGLTRLADLWNADLRRAQDWAPGAPDLPIILTQTKRTSYRMHSDSGRIYKRGIDGPRLAQWAATYHDGRLVLAGPNHHLPASDGAHLTPAGYFRLGEQIARQFWACTFGTGPLRFTPLAVIRQSAAEFDIVFKIPSGSLVMDITNVTDALDGQKGFVCWDNTANVARAISNVAIKSLNSVRVTLSDPPTRTVELWCDYALWGDDAANVSQTSTGPRGNLRTDTAYVSLLGNYGGSATTDHDWCPAFRIPVPFWGGRPSTWMVDGRL